MPNPNRKMLNIGLWDKSCKPSKCEYQVLVHLAAHPGSRVLLEDGNSYYAGITNCEQTGTPGFVVRGKMHSLRSGAIYDYKSHGGWVEPDKRSTLKCPEGTRIYKITKHGFEAIAQYDARTQFEDESLKLARRLLVEARTSARALKPK